VCFFKSFLFAVVLLFVGCGEFSDDLFPTDADRREIPETDAVGPRVGQQAPDFSTVNSANDSFQLSSELAGLTQKAVVLYYAMWCPICNSHLDHMLQVQLPQFPDTKFIVIDYVSGSVQDVRSNVVSNGYSKARLTVVADLDNSILDSFEATMGTTVVIDASGIIRMNEDYKDGSRLSQILNELQ
jgi:peroxiredoxin